MRSVTLVVCSTSDTGITVWDEGTSLRAAAEEMYAHLTGEDDAENQTDMQLEKACVAIDGTFQIREVFVNVN